MRSTPAGRQARALELVSAPAVETSIVDDIKLFATFFLGGLTFMTVYLA